MRLNLICETHFAEKSGLHIHTASVHEGDRPFHCQVCGASFRKGSHLKEHTRIHTGEKPFRCYGCGSSFRRSFGLKTHAERCSNIMKQKLAQEGVKIIESNLIGATERGDTI